ncbi:MAG: hypothetical protein HY260_03100 [Chloroflexi bacterium]|nr:hypothetical protein [Chloroflexota bacterium]
MQKPIEIIKRLAEMVAETQEVEYSCDDVYCLLDQCVEAVARGEDLVKLMPLVQQHLDMCPDCREEFEALLRVVRAGMSAV